MGYAHAYATAVMRRGRFPMEPADFVPDWADRPRKGKHFPGAPYFPLPEGGCPAAATVQQGLFGPRGEGEFTLPLLGGMLKDSYGLTGRRLAIQANSDLGTLPFYTHANWSRGTASGGGLYPIGIHWVAGPSGPLTPGVYHYATPHHAMQRLLAGDVTAEVRGALGDDATVHQSSDQFLVLGVKFWQNAFKYNSFSYHVVTMDIGALVQTWRIWARARGLHLGPALWFDEERLGRLLGLSSQEEGVFAVVPLRWEGGPGLGPGTSVGAGRVRLVDQERSRRVFGFETVQRIHAATLEGAAERPPTAVVAKALTPSPSPSQSPSPSPSQSPSPSPSPSSSPSSSPSAPAAGELVALPRPAPLALGVRQALRERRSSFGRFTATTPIGADQLAAALAAAAAGGRLDSDVESPDGPATTRLYVFVNHVAGVPAGVYGYDAASGALRLLRAGEQGGFLQRNYFLANYNLEQAAAVIVPTAPTAAVLDAVGDRGLRLVNAAVGAVSQALYTAASALGLGCGVALGFDCLSYIEELGLEGEGPALDGAAEVPLLIMMIGHERPQPADFSFLLADSHDAANAEGAGDGR